MEAQLTLLTLGVDDLHRSASFLRDCLGIPTHGVIGHGADDPVAFYDFGGMTVALRQKERVAAEQVGAGPGGQSMRLSVSSCEAVDELLRRAVEGGATIVRPARAILADYSGAFEDLDGRQWEVSFQAGYWSLA